MSSQLQEILRRAFSDFETYTNRGKGAIRSIYLDTPVELTVGQPILEEQTEADRNTRTNDPFIFLSGLQSASTRQYVGQTFAPRPSLSVILAEYGNGKTELAHQLCTLLWEKQEGPLPLPIALASCRDRRILEQEEWPSQKQFCSFIFQNLLGMSSSNLIEDAVMPAFQGGEILLILDGLDEVVRTPHQYEFFFVGLGSLFTSQEGQCEGRAAISMRLENLSSIDPSGRKLSRRFIQGCDIGAKPPVYFLHLDFFTEERVEIYLGQRVPRHPELFEKVKDRFQLASTLRRPLLLKIFGDLAAKAGPAELDELLNVPDAAGLIGSYIEQATAEAEISQRELSDFIWSNKRLAKTSLNLYRTGRVHIQAEELRDGILEFNTRVEKPHRLDQDPKKLSDEDALLGVHKCPFLILSDVIKPWALSFSHRCFFEYFTVWGMVEGVMKATEEAGGVSRPTKELDELVLNVDMRKFLRSLLEKDEISFKDVTRRSYGLEEPEIDLWRMRPPLVFQFQDTNWVILDHTRLQLMYAMTDPDDPPKGIDESVRDFLLMEDWGLHPGYLMYNHEAVAEYLMSQRLSWSPQGRMLRELYSEVLSKRLRACLTALVAHEVNRELESATSRLVERILHIAVRLGYTWVAEDYLERKPEILKVVHGEDTRERIRVIFEDMESALPPPPAFPA